MRQIGITEDFAPKEGYGNWFWGLTPSCLVSLVQVAGFKVDWRFTEAFAQTLICTAVDVPFYHHIPNELESQEIAANISAAGIARPA